MSYQPTAEDFEGIEEAPTYKPSASDFEEQNPNPEKSESKGFSGIAWDTLDLVANMLDKSRNFLIDFPEEKEKTKNLIKEKPLHAAEQLLASSAEVGKDIINSPVTLSNYLRKKEVLPKDYGNFLPLESLAKGLKEPKKSGELNPIIPEGTEKALGINPDEEGARIIRAFPEVAETLAGITGLAKVLGKGITKTRKVIQHRVNPYEESVNKAKNAEEAMRQSLDTAKGEKSASQFGAAKELNEQKAGLHQEHEVSANKVHESFPDKPERQVMAENVEYFKKTRKGLKAQFDKEYDSYKKEVGEKPIKEPFNEKEINKEINLLRPASQRMAEGLIPNKVELEIINPHTNKPYVIETPPKNASAQDYIDFMRTTRDAAHASKIEASTATEYARKKELSDQSERLKKLSSDADRRFKQSVTEDEYKKFEDLQSRYGTQYRPFMDQTSPLYKAAFKGTDTGTIFHELNQPKNAGVYDLLKSVPYFKELALSEKLRAKTHPLAEESAANQAKKIKDMLKESSGLRDFMTPDQIKLLEGHANIGKKIENVDKILTKVGSGLLQKAIQEHQIKGLTKMNPKAEALLEDISGKQLTEEQVKKMMKEAGVNTAAEQAKFLERKQALELLSNALHVFGLGKITHIL